MTIRGVDFTSNTVEATTHTARAYEQITTTLPSTPGTLNETRHVLFNESTIHANADPDDVESATDFDIVDDDGTNTNMATTGQVNGAIEFDYATNSQYTSTTTSFTDNEWEIAFWANMPVSTGSNGYFGIYMIQGGSSLSVEFFDDGDLYVNIYTDTIDFYIYDDGATTDQETDLEGRHHYTISQSASDGSITVNVDGATYTESGTGTTTQSLSGAKLEIGRFADMVVDIDDWREYDEILSASQRALIYNSGAGTESSLDSLDVSSGSTTTTMQYVNRDIAPNQFGELDHYSTTQTITVSAADTWYEFNNFNVSYEYGVNCDETSNSITILSNGIYKMTATATVAMPVNADVEMGISKNDTMLTKPRARQYGAGNGKYDTMVIQDIFTATAGDKMKLEFRNVADTSDIQVYNASFIIERKR
jgi:hypothetical protein